ncbi:MAG: RNA polymerase sigma factor [Flavobacteriales bacterium]
MAGGYCNFTQEVLSFRDGLRYFALSLTQSEEESNDLLQETMLKAFTYRDKFRADTNLKAWLYTIMKNIFINNYRKNVKKRYVLSHGGEMHYMNIPQTSGRGNDPETQLLSSEIAKKIDALDLDYRMPFRMYFEGFKYKEIAEDLGLPIGTVKSRIFLARKQLMEELKEYVH